MLSRTGEYALRALIHLAQREEDWPISGVRIAEETGIPPKYLSKILGNLARAGVLESSPGKTGGFRLRRPAKQLPLLEILLPYEQFEHRRCPFGNRECNDFDPCAAHDAWKKVIETEQRFLSETTVYDVALRTPAKKSRAASGGRKKPRRK